MNGLALNAARPKNYYEFSAEQIKTKAWRSASLRLPEDDVRVSVTRSAGEGVWPHIFELKCSNIFATQHDRCLSPRVLLNETEFDRKTTPKSCDKTQELRTPSATAASIPPPVALQPLQPPPRRASSTSSSTTSLTC